MTDYIIQVVTAAIGSLGFAILFNNYRGQLGLIALGGGISWIAYLLFFLPTDNAIVAIFASTVIVAIIAEIGARLVMTPVITLLVPMLIPLIPGGDLFRSMRALVNSDMEAFTALSRFTVLEACAIAFGILVVTLCTQIMTKSKRYVKMQQIEKTKRKDGST